MRPLSPRSNSLDTHFFYSRFTTIFEEGLSFFGHNLNTTPSNSHFLAKGYPQAFIDNSQNKQISKWYAESGKAKYHRQDVSIAKQELILSPPTHSTNPLGYTLVPLIKRVTASLAYHYKAYKKLLKGHYIKPCVPHVYFTLCSLWLIHILYCYAF